MAAGTGEIQFGLHPGAFARDRPWAHPHHAKRRCVDGIGSLRFRPRSRHLCGLFLRAVCVSNDRKGVGGEQGLSAPSDGQARMIECSNRRGTKGDPMTTEEKIEDALRRINPRLEDLSEGYVEFLEFNGETGELTIKTFGGRLL